MGRAQFYCRIRLEKGDELDVISGLKNFVGPLEKEN